MNSRKFLFSAFIFSFLFVLIPYVADSAWTTSPLGAPEINANIVGPTTVDTTLVVSISGKLAANWAGNCTKPAPPGGVETPGGVYITEIGTDLSPSRKVIISTVSKPSGGVSFNGSISNVNIVQGSTGFLDPTENCTGNAGSQSTFSKNNVSLDVEGLSNGNYTISFDMQDNLGASSDDPVSFTVDHEPPPPPPPSTTYENLTINFRGSCPNAGGSVSFASPSPTAGQGQPTGSCTGDCTRVFETDQNPDLTANPDSGCYFDRWERIIPSNTSKTANPWNNLTMDQDKSIEVWFLQNAPSPTYGTVVVNSNIATTWTMSGPPGEAADNGSPSTSKTYNSQPTGSYTITPASLAGYTGPTVAINGTQSLNSGSTITFTLTYSAAPPGGNPECSDGIDNADPEDTIADYPNDPGCTDANDDDETDVGGGTECSDGIDNDGDGDIDLDDADCSGPTDTTEGSGGGGEGGGLSCSPSSQQVYISQVANLSASGGSGYTWSAPNGTPSSGSGATFDVLYGATGNNAVTVTGGGTDQCTVSVIEASCGNASCEGAGGETCSTCPTDCGACALPECSDTADNDGDGFVDYPDDPECKSPEDNSEENAPTFEEF